MTRTVAELMDALPEGLEPPADLVGGRILELDESGRPVPTGRLHRAWTLGSLPARVAAACTADWVRGFWADENERERLRTERQLKTTLQLLGSLAYLRGAVMKLGQVMAHYPDVIPEACADVLGRLHFEAPPMHFALVSELVRRELGAEPGDVFAEFETRAFAAASLGQVHEARLASAVAGVTRVAVKVQYPDIARAIRDDFSSIKIAAAPIRLGRDWDSIEAQIDDMRRMLDDEVDYEREAASQRLARGAFTESDGIVVPAVVDHLTTRRVLTMEYLPGRHLKDFLAEEPAQELRDRHGEQIARAIYRLSYGRHLLYADPHPGNFLFMPDGRLGLLDFGCCHRYTRDDVDYLDAVEDVVHGSREAIHDVIARAADMTPQHRKDTVRLELMEEWCRWVWLPMFFHEGPFDFGDPEYFHRGWRIYTEMVKRRYVRSLPINTWLTKNFFGLRAMLYRLGARVDLGKIVAEEREANGEQVANRRESK